MRNKLITWIERLLNQKLKRKYIWYPERLAVVDALAVSVNSGDWLGNGEVQSFEIRAVRIGGFQCCENGADWRVFCNFGSLRFGREIRGLVVAVFYFDHQRRCSG